MPAALASFILPNLVFVVFGEWFSFSRALVNLDYVFPVLLLVFGWPLTGSLTFALVAFLDIIYSILTIFFNRGEFTDLSTIGYGLRLHAAPMLAAFLLTCLLFWGIGRQLHFRNLPIARRAMAAGVLVVVTALIGLADILNGSSVAWSPGILTVPVDPAYSSLARTARKVLRDPPVFSSTPLSTGEAASIRYWHPPANQTRGAGQTNLPRPETAPNILLVVVESLGKLHADPDRRGLWAPLLELEESYDIECGQIPALGSTVAGELRELCWIRSESLDLQQVHTQELSWSLPKELQGRGYRTVGIHGFYGVLFARHRWYPKLGFDEALFLEQLRSESSGLPTTGIFHHGATDEYIGQLIGDRLAASDQPMFIYWLTLSAHLPINDAYASGLRSPPRLPYLDGLPPEIRLHEILHAAVVSRIATIARTPHKRPCDIIVVGDHRPPFGLRTLRQLYADDCVPYIILRSRTIRPPTPPDHVSRI